jgi:hypothetical protein
VNTIIFRSAMMTFKNLFESVGFQTLLIRFVQALLQCLTLILGKLAKKEQNQKPISKDQIINVQRISDFPK